MRKALMVVVTTAALAAATSSGPAQAGGGRVAAGIIGGLAVGTLLGAAVAQSRPYYGPPPGYVAEPAPMYGGPPPQHCYWTRGEPVWDGYRGAWVRPRMQVCD